VIPSITIPNHSFYGKAQCFSWLPLILLLGCRTVTFTYRLSPCDCLHSSLYIPQTALSSQHNFVFIHGFTSSHSFHINILEPSWAPSSFSHTQATYLVSSTATVSFYPRAQHLCWCSPYCLLSRRVPVQYPWHWSSTFLSLPLLSHSTHCQEKQYCWNTSAIIFAETTLGKIPSEIQRALLFLVVLGFQFGLALARQVLYHLSHSLSPFCFSYFSDRIFHFCLGSASDNNPSSYVST
jgi:hypothetical protein